MNFYILMLFFIIIIILLLKKEHFYDDEKKLFNNNKFKWKDVRIRKKRCVKKLGISKNKKYIIKIYSSSNDIKKVLDIYKILGNQFFLPKIKKYNLEDKYMIEEYIEDNIYTKKPPNWEEQIRNIHSILTSKKIYHNDYVIHHFRTSKDGYVKLIDWEASGTKPKNRAYSLETIIKKIKNKEKPNNH